MISHDIHWSVPHSSGKDSTRYIHKRIGISWPIRILPIKKGKKKQQNTDKKEGKSKVVD